MGIVAASWRPARSPRPAAALLPVWWRVGDEAGTKQTRKTTAT